MTRLFALTCTLVAFAAVSYPAGSSAASESGNAAAALRPVYRIDPDFPREALRAGAQSGQVTARITLDAGGNVTRVDIVDAVPRRLFDHAVVQALQKWRYAEGGAGRTVEVEIAFKQ